MKFWPLYPLILLAWQPVLLAQGVEPLSQLEQKGDDALAAGLWEVAEMHFRQCLASPTLTPEQKSQLAIRLADSLVRAGNFTDALDLLGQSFVAKNPETPFWKAQALAGKGRLKEAIEIFSSLLTDPTATHRREAGFTKASLLLTLDQPEAALDALTHLIPTSDAATVVKIQLYQVEILLDLHRPVDARLALPANDKIALTDHPLAVFLRAQLLLQEGKAADAEAAFQDLVNHPQGQTLTRHHAAAIGLADAIQAQGDTDTATTSLLAFLQEHPDSPVLEAIFKRILNWLPEKPTATDPILERLAQWITPSVLPAIGPIAINDSAASAWPTYPAPDGQTDLLVFSLYARAIGLHRLATPDAKAESARLFNRICFEYPGHFLSSRALYQSARWLLDDGSIDPALAMLESLREVTKSPLLKGEAAYLEARVTYLQGDPKAAIQLFDEAAKTLSAPAARTAKLQAAIARLHSGGPNGTQLIQQTPLPPDPALEADLELERALSTTPPAAARTLIEAFLAHFPEHHRAAEARLAAVEAALSGPTPDLTFVRAQLDILTASAEKSGSLPAPRIALARLRVAVLAKDSATAIATAQTILTTYPGDPVSAEAALTLGLTLFQTGSYNPARLVLEKLAVTDTDPARAQAAWLLAARAAALGGTPQSKEEALILFDKAIASNGPLAAIATLEKAGHLIDMYRLPEASAFLTGWTRKLPENDPLQLPAGLLLGEALYAQGSSNPASLVEALAVYDRLLVRAKDQPALLNRLQYLRGTTLEQLPDEKDPTKKREKQAFQAFHSVLETTTPPVEWEYFERCGFRALALLEKAQRWPVAITVAKKIASFKGPRAEEAATRAGQLQLKHMIWED